jgi:hypothetical protein
VHNQTVSAGPGDIVTARNLDAVVITNVKADGSAAAHILAKRLDWATLERLKVATIGNAAFVGPRQLRGGADEAPAVLVVTNWDYLFLLRRDLPVLRITFPSRSGGRQARERRDHGVHAPP